MPRYVDVREAHCVFKDNMGLELEGLEAARAEVTATLAEIAKERPPEAQPLSIG